jgi:hypothetical protein
LLANIVTYFSRPQSRIWGNFYIPHPVNLSVSSCLRLRHFQVIPLKRHWNFCFGNITVQEGWLIMFGFCNVNTCSWPFETSFLIFFIRFEIITDILAVCSISRQICVCVCKTSCGAVIVRLGIRYNSYSFDFNRWQYLSSQMLLNQSRPNKVFVFW